MTTEENHLLSPEPQDNFVESDYVKEITVRALGYIAAGFPIHFRGPAGTGKTTLAKHIASKIGRPMVLVHGDEEFTTSSLIGGEFGFQSKQVIDNYISSVLKKEQNVVKHWVDNRLTVACRHGFTLLYDEFTRSRPEANNILLSILEEKLVNLPISRGGADPYIQVHPNFTAIFTSNPEEYAGVHKTQDALLDRMITIELDYFDYTTEVQITQSKSGIDTKTATLIVNIIRNLRNKEGASFTPTVRSCVMLAKSIQTLQVNPFEDFTFFNKICVDILGHETMSISTHSDRKHLIRDTVKYAVKIEMEKINKAPINAASSKENTPKLKVVTAEGNQLEVQKLEEVTLNTGESFSTKTAENTEITSEKAHLNLEEVEKESVKILSEITTKQEADDLTHLEKPDENLRQRFLEQADERINRLKKMIQNLNQDSVAS